MTRIFLLLVLSLSMPLGVAAPTRTQICIHNKTTVQHGIGADDVDSRDWDGERPDRNFNGLTIEPNQIICRHEDISEKADRPNFSFFIDGREVRMKYMTTDRSPDLKWYGSWRWAAVQEAQPRYNQISPIVLHGERTIYWHSPYWWVGYACDGSLCDLFEIRPLEQSN
jgi:hypothetical protein